MEEELLLNDSSAANPKFRSGALPAPWVPEDRAWRARGGKSPKNEEPTQVLFLKADTEQQGQVFLSTALRKFHFFGTDVLQDVFLLPGRSLAGSRAVEEGELCDSPGTAPAGCGNAGEILLVWNCLALIAPGDLQLLQTGFSFWLSVAAAGSRLWPHGSDPTSSKVCPKALPSVQTEE